MTASRHSPLSAWPDPIVAIATAPGRGGVGIVRLSGPALGAFAQALLGRALAPRQATYLPFTEADGSAIDHGLALYFAAPHSYTGEDVLELQAHGGPVLLQLLVARCLALAAQADPATGQPQLARLRLAEPGEFTRRAFLNGKLDLAQAEAVADLINASTEAAARSASRSLAGAFSAAIEPLKQALIDLRMLVEASLDFPEEDIDFAKPAGVAGVLQKMQQQWQQIQRQARQGALLREGIKVVIAGQPNVGKSSLLNALAGAELAIVTPIAGTTRDVLNQTIQIHGVPLHVFDTAGLRDARHPQVDEVERIGIDRAWGQIDAADAVLWVHDLTRQHEAAHAQADAAIASQLASRLPDGVPVLHVWNKLDLATAAPLPVMPVATSPKGRSLALSARGGQGLEALREQLLVLAGWQDGAEGVHMARQRHLQALARTGAHLAQARAHLDAASPALELLAEELRLAHAALGDITGEFTPDDLLGTIFSQFCIGK